MIEFIKRIILFLIPICVLFLVLLSLPPSNNDTSYLACIIDKDIIIKESKSRRLIFVGGSNIAFGLDCEQLSNIHNRNAINYGIQGGLGIVFQLQHLKKYIRAGDTIIVIPEYDQFLGDNILGSGQSLAKVITLKGGGVIKDLNMQQVKKISPFYFNASIKRIKSIFSANSDTERKQFNHFGDFIGHLNLPNRKPFMLERYFFQSSFSSSSIKTLEEHQIMFRKKGVEFYLSFPPYPRSLYLSQKKVIDTINSNLINSKLNIIGNPKNYIFNDSLFFEFSWHLNKNGRKNRTTQFLDDYKNRNKYLIRHFNK